MSWVEVPGGKISFTPAFFKAGISAAGMMPPAKTVTAGAPFTRSSLTTRANRELCAPDSQESPTKSTPSCKAALAMASGVWRIPV